MKKVIGLLFVLLISIIKKNLTNAKNALIKEEEKTINVLRTDENDELFFSPVFYVQQHVHHESSYLLV